MTMSIGEIQDRFGVTIDPDSKRAIDCPDIYRITRNLFLGSYEQGACKINGLRSLKIKNILTVGVKMPPVFQDEFDYKTVQILDDKAVDISLFFSDACRFISEAISKGNNVFVHCWAGISRSSTIVICYMMKSHGLNYIEAFEKVRKARYFIDPNSGFRQKLKRLDTEMGFNTPLENIDLYDRATFLLRQMYRQRFISLKNSGRVEYAFLKIFGAYHPDTLAVMQEIEPFADRQTARHT